MAYVTPFLGVWIEIERIEKAKEQESVTPFLGVWIEILHMLSGRSRGYVTPFLGVWIEIAEENPQMMLYALSLPSWECGKWKKMVIYHKNKHK